jgi:hypothetical protein
MSGEITIPVLVLFSMLVINVICMALTLRLYICWRYYRADQELPTRILSRVLRRVK